MTIPAPNAATRPATLPILLILSCGALLSGCSPGGNDWGWYVVNPWNPQGYQNIVFLLKGFGSTIVLSVVAAVLSITIGLLVALPALSGNKWVRLPNRIYVEFIRAIPLLPMLFWVFYGLPQVFKAVGLDIPIDPFWGAVLTLALSDSAFTAEIFRAGIQS